MAQQTAKIIADELPHALSGFEPREQQIRMAESCERTIRDGGALVIEAATGCGKSLAYLIPAAIWAIENDATVIVSTGTIALQEQLVRKDLPTVALLFPDLRYQLAKGKTNFLCRRRTEFLAEALDDASVSVSLPDDSNAEDIRNLWRFSESGGWDGDRGSLAADPSAATWRLLQVDNDSCDKNDCALYASCHYYSAKRRLEEAHIVVANHSLLLAHLSLKAEIGKSTILPEASRIVLDEAHKIAEVATNCFGSELSQFGLRNILGRLWHERENKGALPQLVYSALRSAPEIYQSLYNEVANTEPLIADARSASADFFQHLGKNGGTIEMKDLAEDAEAKDLAEDLAVRLVALSGKVGSLPKIGNALAREVEGIGQRLGTLAEELRQFFHPGDDPDTCRWIEAQGQRVALKSAPINVAPMLGRVLFNETESVIMCSATLTVRKSFRHFVESVGAPEHTRRLALDSPFDYRRNCKLMIPRDMPDPKLRGYTAMSIEAIRQAILTMRGDTLVLFTSYSHLDEAWKDLTADTSLSRLGLNWLRQGNGITRSELLRRFASEPRSILMATDSFWEGIDVRGNALRCVVIARLPFNVPTDPLEKARYWRIEQDGGNAFMSYSIPRAALKLKQGFGRLIRSKTDTGTVILLDSRLINKGYGAMILDSLPPARRLLCTVGEIGRLLT
jgi:ATP-dependent DNA helicase DinG